ncbi:MAG: AsmA-like C-terminal region-containing protein [Alphaproteobacteria bacterium]|nr:AsmA-like C-terminal region-containing protein [Alphaproteobacteria bacterium]
MSSFILEGDEIYASGSALVRDELSTVENLRFDRLEYGDNNLAMVLQNIDGGYRIRAKGPSLDLKPLFDEAQESDISNEAVDLAAEAEKPLIPFNLDFHGEFDWVVIGKERELRKVNAQLQCSPELCESVDTRGVTGQSNEFIYQIKRIDGIRELNFTAQNAGSFLKAMDLYDNMVGGAITVRGRFNDNSADKPFNGKVDVTKHTISNAPILAKIASLLSVSGIGDALSGNGITFQHIVAQINYAKGVAKIKDGKAYGPALGITVEDGWVDTNAKQLYLNGTFVPSYTLNTALDNIPVIGEVLTGGKGEGVFAANYKVSGEYPDNAEVTVNPLTMLAPGFLRNIFGGKSNKVVPPSAEKKSAVPAAAIDNKQN